MWKPTPTLTVSPTSHTPFGPRAFRGQALRSAPADGHRSEGDLRFPLQHPLLGRLQVDLVHDPQHAGRPAIGGVEYLDRALGRLPHDDGRTTLVHLCRKHARA